MMKNIHGALLYTAKIKRKIEIPKAVVMLGEYKLRLPLIGILAITVVITLLVSQIVLSYGTIHKLEAGNQDLRALINQYAQANHDLITTIEGKDKEISILNQSYKDLERQIDETLAGLSNRVDQTLAQVKGGND